MFSFEAINAMACAIFIRDQQADELTWGAVDDCVRNHYRKLAISRLGNSESDRAVTGRKVTER